MKPKKFIIRIDEWCVAFVEGTYKQLEAMLAHAGITITETVHIHEMENLGVYFDKEIHTEALALGVDFDLMEKVFQEIKSVFDKHGLPFAKGTAGFQEDVKMELRHVCDGRPIKYYGVNILVANGKENYNPKPGHYSIPRDYDELSSVSVDEFNDGIWDVIGTHGRAYRIKPE